jgi:hypothetical protein
MGRGELKFPVKGIDKNWANSDQPPMTSPDMNNVRPYGVSETRLRGGQRPGLGLRYSERISSSGFNEPVVVICQVTSMVT